MTQANESSYKAGVTNWSQNHYKSRKIRLFVAKQKKQALKHKFS